MMKHHRGIAIVFIVLVAVIGGLGAVIALDMTFVSTEVRINARQLDDGRVEFALQQREGNTWGDRMMARGSFLPADVGHDRWLSSGTYAVSIELPEPDDVGEDLMETYSEASSPPDETCVLSDRIGSASQSTFQVVTDSGSGTAFYIGQDEWITNHHVVGHAGQVQLVRGGDTIIANVVGSLPNYDLALLRAPAPFSAQPLRFVVVQPSLGSDVSVIGFPTGVSGTPSLTRGVISRHSPLSQFASFSGQGVLMQIDAALNPGNSGEPIVFPGGHHLVDPLGDRPVVRPLGSLGYSVQTCR